MKNIKKLSGFLCRRGKMMVLRVTVCSRKGHRDFVIFDSIKGGHQTAAAMKFMWPHFEVTLQHEECARCGRETRPHKPGRVA